MPQLSGSKPYHHGNLRTTLLDASMELIRDQGLAKFTFRQLATRTGVSHTAAYRHFSGKGHLVNELAASILGRIATRINYHSLKGIEPRECLGLGALAILRYAMERPDEYRLLQTLGPDAEIQTHAGIEALTALAANCRFKKVEPRDAALQIWSQLHGIADLAIRRQCGLTTRKAAVEFGTTALARLIAALH